MCIIRVYIALCLKCAKRPSFKILRFLCMCIGIKNHIVPCEKCIFWCEKRCKWILALGGPKTYGYSATYVTLYQCISILVECKSDGSQKP